MIHKSFKTELDPNNKQRTLFAKNAGAARWAYNYALEQKKAAMEEYKRTGIKGKIPSYMDNHKLLNQLKGTEVLPWGYEVSKCSFQHGLINCDLAMDHFFRRCKTKTKKKGFPKFKSKKTDKQAFTLNGSIYVEESRIKLPRIGWVRLVEDGYLPIGSKVIRATVSRRAGKWFVSVLVEVEPEVKESTGSIIGVDLGVKTLVTCSDGKVFENIKALGSNLRSLRRLSRRHSKKQPGSSNRNKARIKLARKHFHITNIRKGHLHKITSRLIDENQVIILEDLNVSGMVKNRNLARAISDVGMYEFRRQLEYKAKWYNREIVYVDRFFPSSKTCSSCGWKNGDLELTDRIFQCILCGLEIDRDLNAARNLEAQYSTVGSTGS